jgi:hypothetical protein
MTFFKEIQIGKFVLRFMPSDNGWMCGISKEMMEALETQHKDSPFAWIAEREIAPMIANKQAGAKSWRVNLGLEPEDGDVPIFLNQQTKGDKHD